MDLVFRAIVLFGGVMILLRVVGRRELATMEPIDLILLVVLGDAMQQGLTQSDNSVTGSLIVIFTIGLIQVALAYIAFRSSRMRTVLEGGLHPEELTAEEAAVALEPSAQPLAPGQSAADATNSQSSEEPTAPRPDDAGTAGDEDSEP